MAAWRCTIFGETFTDEELLVEDYVRLEEELKTSWRIIHPLNYATHARAVLGLLYARRANLSVPHARGLIDNLPGTAISDSLEQHAVEDKKRELADEESELGDEEPDDPVDPPEAVEP